MSTPALKRREGELTQVSLTDALAFEQGLGNRPTELAVGTDELMLMAMRLLGPQGGLDALRTVMPNVVMDRSLGERWALR